MGCITLVFRQEDGSPRVRGPSGVLDTSFFTLGLSGAPDVPGQVPDCGIFDSLNTADDTTPQEAELLRELSNAVVAANPEAMAQLAPFFERKRRSLQVGSSVRKGLADAARIPTSSFSSSSISAFRAPVPPSSVSPGTVPRRNTKLPVVPRVPRRSPPVSASPVLLKAHCVVRASADLLRGQRSSSLKRRSAGGGPVSKKVRVNSVSALAQASRTAPITIVVSSGTGVSSADSVPSVTSTSSSTKSHDRTMAQTTVTSSLSSAQMATGLTDRGSIVSVPSPCVSGPTSSASAALSLTTVSGTSCISSSVMSTSEASPVSHVVPVASASSAVLRDPSASAAVCLTPQARVDYLKAHLCENVAKCVPGDANVIQDALAACEMWGVSCVALSGLVTRLPAEDAASLYTGSHARYTVKTSAAMMHACLNRRHPELVDPVTERYLRKLFRYLFVTYPTAVGDLQMFPEPQEVPDEVPVSVAVSVVTSSSLTSAPVVASASISSTVNVGLNPVSSSSAIAVSSNPIVIPESSLQSTSTVSTPGVRFLNKVISTTERGPLAGLFSLVRPNSADASDVATDREPAASVAGLSQEEPEPQTITVVPNTSAPFEVASAGGTPEGTSLDDFINDSDDSGECSTSVTTAYVASEATDETWRPRHIVELVDGSPHVLRTRDPALIMTGRRRRTKPLVLQVGGSSVLGESVTSPTPSLPAWEDWESGSSSFRYYGMCLVSGDGSVRVPSPTHDAAAAGAGTPGKASAMEPAPQLEPGTLTLPVSGTLFCIDVTDGEGRGKCSLQYIPCHTCLYTCVPILVGAATVILGAPSTPSVPLVQSCSSGPRSGGTKATSKPAKKQVDGKVTQHFATRRSLRSAAQITVVSGDSSDDSCLEVEDPDPHNRLKKREAAMTSAPVVKEEVVSGSDNDSNHSLGSSAASLMSSTGPDGYWDIDHTGKQPPILSFGDCPALLAIGEDGMFDFVREEVGVLITYPAHWPSPPPTPAEADRGTAVRELRMRARDMLWKIIKGTELVGEMRELQLLRLRHMISFYDLIEEGWLARIAAEEAELVPIAVSKGGP